MVTKFDKNCRCENTQILSLKAKLETKFGLSDYDIISEENQENLSTKIEANFDRFSLLPPDPGKEVDMSHCNKEITNKMNNMISQYAEAFAKHKFDTGLFTGFQSAIEVEQGASVIERERPMRPTTRDELKPMVEELLKHGIIKHADKQGPFLSNCHGVIKPEKGVSIAGKTDLYLLKKSGKDHNHGRLTLDLRNLNKYSCTKPKINLPNFKRWQQSLRTATSPRAI